MSNTIYGKTVGEAIPNTNYAVVDCTTTDGSYVIRHSGTATQAYARVGVWTAVGAIVDDTNAIYSPVTGPFPLLTGFNGGLVYPLPSYPGNITVTGLSTGQQYSFVIQGSTGTDTSTATNWTNVGDRAELTGHFTTLTAVPDPPVITLTESATQGVPPFEAHLTYLTQSGTMVSPTLDSITWDYGDGNTETFDTPNPRGGPTYDWFHPVHTYPITSVYTVVATGTNISGTATGSIVLTVLNADVTASFTTATAAGTERRVNATLTDTSVLAISSDLVNAWSWAVTGPGTSTNSVTSTASSWSTVLGTNVTSVGIYSVNLTVTSVMAATDSITVTNAFTVNYLPLTVTFTATPVKPIVDSPVSFYNNSVGDGMSALWNFGDTLTSTSTATTITHSYTAAGLYDVTLVVTGSYQTNTTLTATASRSDYIWAVGNDYHNLLGGLLQDIQAALMDDPDAIPCEAFTEFGGADNVISIYYRRLFDFLKQTQLTATETTLAADTNGVYPLPSDLIRLLRVEVGGVAVLPIDEKQADLYEAAWESNTVDPPYGYNAEPEDALTLRLVPKRTSQTVKVLYVAAPTIPAVPADCVSWGAIPVPRAFSWAIKWGVLADLLAQEGEMNDPVRAKFAEELYTMGVELAKKLFTTRGGA